MASKERLLEIQESVDTGEGADRVTTWLASVDIDQKDFAEFALMYVGVEWGNLADKLNATDDATEQTHLIRTSLFAVFGAAFEMGYKVGYEDGGQDG